jgi:hypothetical protein
MLKMSFLLMFVGYRAACFRRKSISTFIGSGSNDGLTLHRLFQQELAHAKGLKICRLCEGLRSPSCSAKEAKHEVDALAWLHHRFDFSSSIFQLITKIPVALITICFEIIVFRFQDQSP